MNRPRLELEPADVSVIIDTRELLPLGLPHHAKLIPWDDRYAATRCGRILSRAHNGGVFGISQGTVQGIAKGKSWGWLA